MDNKEINITEENEHKLSKKKIISVVVIIGILIALGLGYYFANKSVPETKEENQALSAELFSSEKDKIESVSVKTEKAEFKITNGKEITISPENEDLSSVHLSTFLDGYTLVYGQKQIKDGIDRLKEYGIDKDNNYFEITTKDKNSYRFCVGNNINGSRYVLNASDNTVWIVPASCSSMLLNEPKLNKDNGNALTISFDYENIYSVSLSKNNNQIFLIKRVSDTTALPYNFYSGYELSKPFSEIAYSTEFTNFLKNISVAHAPIGHVGSVAENSAKYGLNEGYTLTVKDSAKTHTLKFGNQNEAGVYMAYNDYPNIYIVPDAIYSIITKADPKDFITPYIDLYEVDSVEEITISSKGKTYDIKVNNKDKTYTINGKTLSEENFNSFFNAISDLSVYKGANAKEEKGDVVCRITFKVGKETYTRTYYDCNSSMVYLTTRESGLNCFVKKSSLDSILSGLNKLDK